MSSKTFCLNQSLLIFVEKVGMVIVYPVNVQRQVLTGYRLVDRERVIHGHHGGSVILLVFIRMCKGLTGDSLHGGGKSW